ncbi:MAG TPA: flagellar basal body rod protein FlgC, partial [Planctomycetaceae bacterium]|nr:flagellar basal body rod protein FlgC [Planctomycetaceae bacterium]
STSALVAQRQRLNTIAGNIANLHSTRDADGNVAPFQRRLVTFARAPEQARNGAAGEVQYRVEIDAQTPPRRVFEPGHPDADAEGYVSYPNIDLITEFVNALEAGRAYEANVAAVEVTKEMAQLGLRILA